MRLTTILLSILLVLPVCGQQQQLRTVDTIAQLKNLPVAPSMSTVLVKGRDAVDDGGGGIFTWNSSDSTAEDGGVVFESDRSSSGRWNRVYKQDGPMLNALWFSSLESAATKADALGVSVYAPSGTHNFTNTIQFTSSNSGIVGEGLNTVLIYHGNDGSNAIEFGSYNTFSADPDTDIITAEGHDFSTATLIEVWTDFGVLPAGLSGDSVYYVGTISGDTFKLYASSSNATSELNPIDFTDSGSGTLKIDIRYGTSKENVRFENFYLKPDFTQLSDEFSRPTNWFIGRGIYLRGARNGSMVKNLRIDAFQYGLYVKYGWLSRYEANRMQGTQYGISMIDECNNVTLEGNILRRIGDVNDLTDGYALKFKSSYGFTVQDTDIETSNGYGAIYEHCHGFNHIGGDIEGNDFSVRKIVLMGKQDSPDFASNQNDWTRGVNIFGVRFYRSLGIEVQAGVHSVNIAGCTFELTSSTPTTTTAVRTSGVSTYIRDIQLGPNDYYGDNETYYPTPMADFRFLEKNTRATMSFTSPPLDVTDANGYAIGYVADDFEVTKVQIIEDTEASTTDVTSLTVDIGVDLDVGTIASNLAWSPSGVALYLSPFGVTEYTSDLGEIQAAGLIRARIGDVVGSSPSGNIKVRVFYKLR